MQTNWWGSRFTVAMDNPHENAPSHLPHQYTYRSRALRGVHTWHFGMRYSLPGHRAPAHHSRTGEISTVRIFQKTTFQTNTLPITPSNSTIHPSIRQCTGWAYRPFKWLRGGAE